MRAFTKIQKLLKKNQKEILYIKKIITEFRNSPKVVQFQACIDRRKLDKSFEILQTEEKKKGRMKKSKWSLRDFCNTIKITNISIIRVLEEEESCQKTKTKKEF